MLTATGTAMVTATIALNAYALMDPTLPRTTIVDGLRRAQCENSAKQAAIVGNEWLGGGLQIFEVSCSTARSILFAVPTDPAAKASLIKMQDWRDGKIVASYRVTSPRYEPDSRTLSSVEGRKGAADCGTIKEWKWTGWTFRLIHVWNKDVCDGDPFVWDNRERWQVYPKPAEGSRQPPADFTGPSLAKWPPRWSHQSSARLGSPASVQMMKNQPQPVAAAMKPAPDDR